MARLLRPFFVASALAWCLLPGQPASFDARAEGRRAPDSTTLRILQWNVHHGVGTDGKYDLDRIATWIAKLDPDLASLNEVERYTSWGNEDQPARYEALLEQKTGKDWHQIFVHERGDWDGRGQGHALLSAIRFDSISRHTIAYTRTTGRATVTVNGRSVALFTTHWDYQRAHTRQRVAQALDTVALAAKIAEPRIIAGDLNAVPTERAVDVMKRQYHDAWSKAKKEGLAESFPGNDAGNTRNQRIDYIFFSKMADALTLTKVVIPDTRDTDGHMPSDHRPILAIFDVR